MIFFNIPPKTITLHFLLIYNISVYGQMNSLYLVFLVNLILLI